MHLEKTDPEAARLLRTERAFRAETLDFVPSNNHPSPSVLEAERMYPLFYSENDGRNFYYPGCETVKAVEDLAKARALGEGAAGEAIAARLVRCSFVAPQWHKPDLDARTTLVAAMLVSLAGSEAKVVSHLIVPTGSISAEIKEASEPRDPQGRRLWASETLN